MDKNIRPKVSICIPYYPKMIDGGFFLKRCLDSISEQTFTDYEIIITDKGSMSENTNNTIRASKGEIIKILYQDDYFAHPDALKVIVDNFNGDWLITGVDNNPNPHWTDDIETGNNKLGSPSALSMRHKEYFDENLNFLLDCDLYKRLYEQYGEPQILNGINVCIGIHEGQHTNIMADSEKVEELNYMNKKYE